jgi:hypothetical protein
MLKQSPKKWKLGESGFPRFSLFLLGVDGKIYMGLYSKKNKISFKKCLTNKLIYVILKIVKVTCKRASTRRWTMENKDELGYNGWKNYATWNVVLWLANDVNTRDAKIEFQKQDKRKAVKGAYRRFLNFYFGGSGYYTPDKICYRNRTLDYDRLDEWVKDENE